MFAPCQLFSFKLKGILTISAIAFAIAIIVHISVRTHAHSHGRALGRSAVRAVAQGQGGVA